MPSSVRYTSRLLKGALQHGQVGSHKYGRVNVINSPRHRLAFNSVRGLVQNEAFLPTNVVEAKPHNELHPVHVGSSHDIDHSQHGNCEPGYQGTSLQLVVQINKRRYEKCFEATAKVLGGRFGKSSLSVPRS